MKAPSGFEPEMEVLQTGPGLLTCCLVLLSGRPYSPVLPGVFRPILVVGRDDTLPSLSQIPVIPLSGQTRGLSWEVRLTPKDGVPTECVLKPEWIRSVDRALIGDAH